VSDQVRQKLTVEMGRALARARQSLAPVVFLSRFREFLEKHQCGGNRSFLESLLSSLDRDFFAPLSQRVEESDAVVVTQFASLYTRVADLVQALAPASPLAERLSKQHQELSHLFHEISSRTKAQKELRRNLIEGEFQDLLEKRKRDVKKEWEVRVLLKRAIRFATISAFTIACYRFTNYSAQKYENVETMPVSVAIVVLVSLLMVFWLLGFAFGGREVGCGSLFILGLIFVLCAFSNRDDVVFTLLLLIGTAELVLAAVYFSRYRLRIEAAHLTAEESASYQQSLRNVEDHFRQEEALQRARAVLAVAKQRLASSGVNTQVQQNSAAFP